MRRLPLLVLVYVTLDFANPLMPGAVRFEEGSIEVVQGNRAARAGAPVVLAPAILPTAGVPWSERALARPAPVAPAAPARPLRVVRQPALERPAASPSPTEDH